MIPDLNESLSGGRPNWTMAALMSVIVIIVQGSTVQASVRGQAESLDFLSLRVRRDFKSESGTRKNFGLFDCRKMCTNCDLCLGEIFVCIWMDVIFDRFN